MIKPEEASLMSFWWKVKKRYIREVAIAYVILVGLLVQIVSRIFDAQDLPAWAITLAVALIVVGLPVVLYLTWIITGKQNPGIEKTSVVGSGSTAVNSIAVLPFEDLSPRPDQKYVVDGLSEELLNRLSRIPDLQVIARTSSFCFKDSPKKVPEIAEELGVAHVLEGSVRRAGGEFRISVRLIRASDGVHLWSETYSRQTGDIFAVQADIATNVANELCTTLGIDCSPVLPGSTENLDAYELYLFAEGLILEGNAAALRRALESLDAALAIDSRFVHAWVRKAVVHNFLAVHVSRDFVANELSAGLDAAIRAIELNPDLAAGHAALGHNRSFCGDWIEAESAYRQAFELAQGPISSMVAAVPIHYLGVGHVEKANELLAEIRGADPLNGPNRAFYMLSFALLGDMERSEAEYQRGRVLFGAQWLWGNVFIMLLRLGAGKAITGKALPALKNNTISGAMKKCLNSPQEGLSELRRLYIQERSLSTGNLVDIAFWAAHFGDPEFAMTIMEKVVEYNAESIFYFWLPVMHEVRQLPRFKAFVGEIGLVDYWKEFGWPDMCRPLGNGNFGCD
jgi:TolB-like protein